jgi:hypothetical protein
VISVAASCITAAALLVCPAATEPVDECVVSPRCVFAEPAARPVHGSATALSKDLSGWEPSAYRGKYFNADQEPYRQCVGTREASFGYTARGGGNLDGVPGGDYGGTYQMSLKLQHGVTWMLYPELKAEVGKREAKRLTRILRSLPAEKWNRYWQDAAFYTILNWRGKGTGKHHWYGGRWSCSPTMTSFTDPR